MAPKSKVSRRLVIDASIARSSGGPEATYPTSVRCRDFLEAIFTICHRVVMTPDIREEWDKHQSRFAREWLRRMISKKKLIPLQDIESDRELWSQLEAMTDNNEEREKIIKDILLLEAALQTDKTIASLDEKTARKFFHQAAQEMDELKPIVWVNPDRTEENSIEWLEQGAPPDWKRMLGTSKA